MAKKQTFGEYSAYETKGGIRFMKNNKLFSEKKVPPEVVDFLKSKLAGTRSRVEAPKEEPKEVTLKDIAQPQPSEAAVENALENSAKDMEEVTEEASKEQMEVNPDFLDSVSIHTASLDDIAQSLMDRFGIYTVHLKRLPNGDEINPLTGEPFTKHHLGIAYQAAIRASSNGVLTRDPEFSRSMLDQGREITKRENFQSSFEHIPENMAEARQANTFDFRTSVRGNQEVPTHTIEHVKDEGGVVRAVQRELTPEERQNWSINGAGAVYNEQEDEMIVEPRFGKKVIRPDW